MTTSPRVLDPQPVTSLGAWLRAGGGKALDAARAVEPVTLIDTIGAAGLRGRGGAGFPTATKWRAVAANHAPDIPTTVVVNAAEGEPGSFKDRMILRRNPYRVIEGAMIAATAVGADRVVVAVKATARTEKDRLNEAVGEIRAAGWADRMQVLVVEGPSEYLYGEETALLEVLDGRHPFPRIAPPFREGVDQLGDDTTSAAETDMAGPGGATAAPPTLVNNVETLANVPAIVLQGPEWFRSLGTEASPGTIVCTVSGRTRVHGVAEVALGTPLADVVETIGGGPLGARVVAVLSGVSNPLLPGGLLDTPLSYEAMQAAGSGLGTGGFLVFDETVDLVAVAQGVSRFLAVESCGQCTPCKQDGLFIAGALDRLRRSEPDADDLQEVTSRLTTVADGARCFLATQHQLVVQSLLALFPEVVAAHADGSAPPVEPELIAPILDLVSERFVLDEAHAGKQPDWSYDAEWSGSAPADSIDERSGGPV